MLRTAGIDVSDAGNSRLEIVDTHLCGRGVKGSRSCVR